MTDDSSSRLDSLFPLPIDKRGFHLIFYSLILLYLVHLFESGFRQFSREDMLFPVIVGVPTAVLCIVHLVFTAYPSLEEKISWSDPDSESRLDRLSDGEATRSAAEKQRFGFYMILWVTVLPVLVYFLGYLTVLPPYVFAFILFFKKDLRLALGVTVVFSIFVYVLFIVILGMIPWEGVLDVPTIDRLLS
jgi:hypothetical protein